MALHRSGLTERRPSGKDKSSCSRPVASHTKPQTPIIPASCPMNKATHPKSALFGAVPRPLL
eukprot:9027180-Pyramimonas_sp.AAC.1